MTQRRKRRIARYVLPVGLLLAAASVTVLTWGLGLFVGVGAAFWACFVLTDLRPDYLR